jgi:3-hydroxyisobutyrate dehydrogenase-like beta-hydroxyacid dehydrogenase
MSQEQRAVGLIGMGLLGSALAERLLSAGYTVTGWDVDPQRRLEHAARGGQVAASCGELFSASRRVLLSLPTSEVVFQVLHECGGALRPGLVIIDTTTGEPEATAKLGSALAKRGVHYLDATVAGSSAQARAGEAVLMVGGEPADFSACGDLFASLAKQTFHVGGWGSGARMKLVVNLVLGLNRAVLAEGLAFAQAQGLDTPLTLEILRSGAAYSCVMDTKGEKMLQRDFTPQARLSQHLKDVRLILAAGWVHGAALPLSALHEQLLQAIVAAGYGECDNSAIIEAFGKPACAKLSPS